jgi:hypothetical protein
MRYRLEIYTLDGYYNREYSGYILAKTREELLEYYKEYNSLLPNAILKVVNLEGV